MEIHPTQFLDVPTLLESSQPGSRPAWTWYGLGAFVLLVIVSGIGGANPTPIQWVVQALSMLLMMGLFVAMGIVIWLSIKRLRAERQTLQAIEEWMQLRCWSEAAAALNGVLSRPMRTMASRIQALVYLSSVLTRYHRFGDALAVQEYLLKNVHFDPAGDFALKLARAMVMLREDHLVDADRAISELRRLAGRQESGGLALVEIYRDVKTGHPNEAIEVFENRLATMRQQLGMRLADAYGLMAQAYDLLAWTAQAQAAWTDATVLAPASELVRRYPEVESVAAKYSSAVMPTGAG